MYRGRTDDDAHLEANSWCCVPCVLERVHVNVIAPIGLLSINLKY